MQTCPSQLLQVMAAVFGPKEVTQRSQLDTTGAIVRCEYAMAAFSTGEAGQEGGGLQTRRLSCGLQQQPLVKQPGGP